MGSAAATPTPPTPPTTPTGCSWRISSATVSDVREYRCGSYKRKFVAVTKEEGR
jgi:hypothetical protein